MDRFLLALRALGPARILATLLGIGAVIAIVGYVAEQVSTPGLSLLYGRLTPEEASSMAGWLDGQGVPYEIRDDGSVYVPFNRVGQLRLAAAGQGLVGSSTTGYEVFDQASGFGTTSFVQNINARRALEGELARTISSMPAVANARVQLALHERKLFEQDPEPSKAGIKIDLAGRILNQNQLANIAHLVAASVPNLQLENITIVDQNGNLVFHGLQHGGGGPTNRQKDTLEQSLEKDLVAMLEKVVGAGKASVQVTAILNTERIEEQSEIFDPAQSVVRSEQRVEDSLNNTQSTPSGAVGLTGNIPGEDGGGVPTANTNENQTRTEETINYEVTRTLRNLVRESGEVQRLSVAVLLEGRYDVQDGQELYIPFDDQQLDQLRTLVQTAIGFNEERGDEVSIIDMQFTPLPEPEAVEIPLITKQDIFRIAEYGVLLIGIVLIIFMIIKPGMNAINTAVTAIMPPPPPPPPAPAPAPAAATPTAASAAAEAVDNANKMEVQMKESMVKQIHEIVDQHPEETLNVVRGWMGDDGGTKTPEGAA